jgi:diguanylate cyclase (GGDEF)-like protein
MLPLIAKGESIGLVELMAHTPVAISEDNLELARTMASEAAMALENARLYEDARRLADRDPLTGFFNHRYLHERLSEEVVRAVRTRRPLSVVMIDLDDFKVVNDTFGHVYGDGVLVHVAERIRAALRESDVAGRWGGEEFLLLLPGADEEGAAQLADRVRVALAARSIPSVPGLRVTASFGVAEYAGETNAEQLLEAADGALYRAKRAGKDRVERAARAAF